MKLEELIHLHNRALDQKADEDPFLAQRIKARLKDREKRAKPALWGLIKKPVLIYGLLFILFTTLNFMLISRLEKQYAPKTRPTTLTQVNVGVFHAEYPGSISRAWREVAK